MMDDAKVSAAAVLARAEFVDMNPLARLIEIAHRNAVEPYQHPCQSRIETGLCKKRLPVAGRAILLDAGEEGFAEFLLGGFFEEG